MSKIELDLIFTLLVSMAVYFVGRALVARVPLLKRFSIPAPVVGGGLMAILLAVLTHLAAAGSAQGTKISKATALRGVSIPLHPGAAKYLGRSEK